MNNSERILFTTANGPHQTVDPTNPALRVCQMLVTGNDSDAHVMGSSVMFLPGLSLTAAHVIDGCFSEYHESPPPCRDRLPNISADRAFSVRAIEFLDGRIPRSWTVVHAVTTSNKGGSYGAITLLLSLPSGETLDKAWQLPLTAIPPRVGTKIMSVGYPTGKAKTTPSTLDVEVRPKVSLGEVVQIFPTGVGTLHPFSGFYCDLRAPGGMSGAPVFTESGYLCGIVSSEFDTIGNSPLSYVALIWSFLTVPLLIDDTQTILAELKGLNAPVTLLDLGRAALFPLLGEELVKQDGTGRTYLDL